MDATISSITQKLEPIITPAPIVFSTINDKVDFWLNWLGVSTGILSAFFTVTVGLLAFLTWKQSELKKQAEQEVERISKTVDEVNKVVASAKKSALLIKRYQTKSAQLVEKIGKDLVDVKGVVDKINTKGADIEELSKKLTKKTNALNSSYTSLATLPSFDPNLYSPITAGADDALIPVGTWGDYFPKAPQNRFKGDIGPSSGLSDILEKLNNVPEKKLEEKE